MTKSLDLNKLKTEIDSRKRQKNLPSTMLGESVGAAPRDVFLNGLLESLRTGKETAASNLVKTVDNKATVKAGGTPKLAPQPVAQPQRQIQPQTLVENSPERDEELFRDLEIKRKQTLAESIENYGKIPPVGAPMTNQPPQQQLNLNEGYLVENVKKIVDNYLIENFAPIVEEAIKSTILELYAVERIKEVLSENKDMIKTLVYETIREIQAKAKSKAQ